MSVLPIEQLGRGLFSVGMKSELMLIQLHSTLNQYKNTCTRRAAILKVDNNNRTHLSNIKNFLQLKYNTTSKMHIKIFKDLKITHLNSEI